MNPAKRHLRVVRDPASPVTRDEIAVRFTSTSGLVASLRKPLNSFRWRGPGTLRFDEQGILVTAKSLTMLGLRPTQRFIPPAEIREVYREGSEVLVQLRGSRSPYFRFWAEDPTSAAQIVARLPTRHTIEFEGTLQEVRSPSARSARGAWLVALFAVSVLASLAWFAAGPSARRGSIPAPQPAPVAPAVAKGSRLPEGALSPQDASLAREDLTKYGERIEALTTEFAAAFDALMDGKVSQEKFAEELQQWLLPQWDDLETKLRRANAAPGSLQETADDHLMAAINNWQLALRAYTDDLRNQRRVVSTFEYLARAERHESRAQEILRNLERRTPSESATKPP